jgi:hypothetical protein
MKIMKIAAVCGMVTAAMLAGCSQQKDVTEAAPWEDEPPVVAAPPFYSRLYVDETGASGASDGSKNKPFATVNAALEKLGGDYAAWKQLTGNAGATSALKASGTIYVIGTVTVAAGQITIDGAYPPIVIRDDASSGAESGILGLDPNGNKGSLITVGTGGDLTLGGALNLVGISGNEASLVTVTGGGKLTLADSAVIRGNTNTNTISNGVYGGGVSVFNSNSVFIMDGGEICGNSISDRDTMRGGGVYVDRGTFIMKNGTIHGNTISGGHFAFGGGVCVDTGSFTMNGGTIYGNSADAAYYGGYGGGVCVDKNASFTKAGGIIYGDTGDSNSNVAGNWTGDRGHAVFLNIFTFFEGKYRNTTAGETVTLDSTGPDNNFWEGD